MNADQIITRCTRNGHTAWQAVATQLGRSVDSVRAQHDPTYLRSHAWAPAREAEPEMEQPIDEDDVSSPYAKGPGVEAEILKALAMRSRCATDLAAWLNRPINSIRARLAHMQSQFLICNDQGRYPRTWSLTKSGRDFVTKCEIQGMAEV